MVNKGNYLKELFINEVKTALQRPSVGDGEAVIRPLNVTENGTYTPPSGVDGYSPVTVNVETGSGVEAHDDTYVLRTPSGKEIAAAFVEEYTAFDATAADIREGKVAATESGVTVGTLRVS